MPTVRPAFILEDVQGADFFRVRTPRPANPSAPTFALNKVDDFSVYRSPHVPDTQLDHVDQKKF